VRAYNLFDGELDEERERPGFSWRRARVGDKIGAEKLGASLYELEPGEKTFPYHYEYGVEEWLLVVSGKPTLRTPEGERELEEGDAACFPRGESGAHQVFNRTTEPARILMLSTTVMPEILEYPDSGKVGARNAKGERIFLSRPGLNVEYWEGED
jgi:uncharacterized cupin superfamily protein